MAEIKMIMRTASVCGAVLGAILTASALTASDDKKSDVLAAGSFMFGGSAVAALLAEQKIRRKYKPIVDVDAEMKRRRQVALKALDEIHRSQLQTEKEIDGLRKATDNEIRGLKQAADEEIRSLKQADENEIRVRKELLKGLGLEVTDMTNQKQALKKEYSELRQRIAELNQDAEDILYLDDAGFAARRYPGLDSKRLADLLKKNREYQKEVAKELLAECKLSGVTLEGSNSKGRALVRQTLQALLRGFNGECDAAISTLRHSNDSTVLGKIERAYNFYEKQAETRVTIPWSKKLYELKEDEAFLVHENALAKQAEREEQLELRRQEREEEQARREAEEAKEAAEQEAEKYEELLEKARKEAAENDQSDEYLEKIRELERRVAEAEANKERAISRAQLTRSGHVYVISNIGSFGHNVFKVGMTRRLEPTERVRELGDASVPFPFDIHAMIFTEDAPGLETAIHRRISSRRLNLVNTRREFFTITWEELVFEAEEAAKEIGVTAEIRWTKVAEAEQYRQSYSERLNTDQPIRFLEQNRSKVTDLAA